MKKLILGIAIVGGLFAWYWISNPSWHYGYRLVIEIDTPTGRRSAFSVINVTARRGAHTGPGGIVSSVRGEGVFFDLGGGRNLTAILGFGLNGSDDKIGNLAFSAFRRIGRNIKADELETFTGTAALTGDLIPAFVTFRDLANPDSGRQIMPDDFERELGGGFRFHSARIEITKERATITIDRKIAFLRTHREMLYRVSPAALGQKYAAVWWHFIRAN